MKALFISNGILYPKSGMGKVSRVNLDILFEIFKKENVDVISLASRGYRENKINDKFDVLISARNKIEVLYNALNNCYNYSPKIEKKILDKIAKSGYNLIFIDDSMFGKLAYKIKKKNPNIKIVTFFHDVRYFLSKQTLKEKGFKYLPAHKAIIYNEKYAVKSSDRIITLNNRESRLLEDIYNRKTSLEIPISLKDEYKIIDNQFKPIKELLFVGADYYPNINGIRWFIKNVLPHLKDKVKLKIVGKGMENYKLEFENENKAIEVIGTVEDISKSYEEAGAVIIPIFEGGGMKVKTAEALMYGKTIFGTKEAFTGYNVKFSEIGGKCETAKEFIEEINEFFSKKYKLINQNSREIFLKEYSYVSAKKKFEKLMKELLK